MLNAQVDGAGRAAAASGPALAARQMRKAYGHVMALRNASLTVHSGEIVGLVGDNGAGKSTLIKILAGIVSPDGGDLEVHGSRVSWANPMHARRAGVAAVFQDLALVEPLSVTANLFLGEELRRGPFVRRREMASQAARRLRELKIRVPSVTAEVGRLSGGQRQGVAIARAVLQGGSIVIMDEPTAALGVRETGRVEEVIHGLRAQGKAVVVVSHDLELVFRIADRIHVMRLGKTVGVLDRASAERDRVVGLITGSISEES